ncbi:MAG: hypothetical protein V1800_01555, partial [Candidatus Latescibacterota bacterium]
MKNKPVLPFGKPIAEHFREAGWFRTEKLLSSWYMLSNDHISVLIDTVKPKIVNVFVHGRYGTLRALLYDTGWSSAMSDWLFGIVPVYEKDGVPFLPLKYGSVVTEPDAVAFDPADNRLTMKGIQFFPSDRKGAPIDSALSVSGYDEDDKEKRLALGSTGIFADWSIHLLDDGVQMSVAYSDEVDHSRLVTFWHPMFTHASCGGGAPPEPIIYSNNTSRTAGGNLILTDD